MKRYFKDSSLDDIRSAILEAGGNEVFFLGRVGEDGKISQVDVLARGDRASVPAIFRSVRSGDAVIHNHPGGDLTPSGADLELASRFGELGVGFYIVDNDVRTVYVVVEPFRERKLKPIDLEELEKMFEPEGAVAKGFKSYEHRAGQVRMARFVAEAFHGDSIAAVEAGTGIGKSLAYLLPSVLWATKNAERVVVSTHTIHLQEQLFFKDLPALKECVKETFSFSLLKGRNQYACRRKIDYLSLEGRPLFEMEGGKELASLVQWGLHTENGSRSDLAFSPSEDAWEQVSADETECPRLGCPFYERCFYFQARRAAAQSDLLVVNHHLLMADISLRSITGRFNEAAVLPPFQRVIVDEAHSLEDAATSYFGFTVSRAGLLKLLGRLQSARHTKKGLLPFFIAKLIEFSSGDSKRVERAVDFIMEKLLPAHRDVFSQVHQCFDRIFLAVTDAVKEKEIPQEEIKVRITPQEEETEIWQEHIRPEILSLMAACKSLSSLLGGFLALFDEWEEARDKKLNSPLRELRSKARRFDEASASLELFLAEDPEHCRWLEVLERRREPVIRIRTAPIEIGREMKSSFYEKFKTIVMTSATLTSGGEFTYFKKRVGLNLIGSERLMELLLTSPFDYGSQVFFGVPLDIPEPGEKGFEEALASLVLEAVSISRGRAFVLFTSFALLRKIFDATASGLMDMGYPCMRQGTESRKRLLERFKRESPAVLFGTDSFWEGVDVKGRALECVILTRLPFRVPSEPIQQARAELIARSGGDPFYEYSIPQAVIRLKQGFGRLIRSREDRGSVLIFDKRFRTKDYGRIFEASLPVCRMEVGNRLAVFSGMKKFFGS
jgi:ATP-dependent DNA helicase DinG